MPPALQVRQFSQVSNSRYIALPHTKPDPILHQASLARQDDHPQKIDLSIGAYTTTCPHTHRTITYTPPSVASACAQVAKEAHPYLPLEGYKPLNEAATTLMFGKSLTQDLGHHGIVSTTTVGGSGALRLALDFWRESHRILGKVVGRVWIADPTWPGHLGVPQGAGWAKNEIVMYELDRICETIEKCGRPGDLVILQGGAQNPTGKVYSRAEWTRILEGIRQRGMEIVWDVAYQGWGGEGLEGDVWAVRESVKMEFECFVCQSFSKGMGLYGERVGVLHAVTTDVQVSMNVRSLLTKIVRNLYSSSPAFGAKVAATVMNNHRLRIQWESELEGMVSRVEETRHSLIDEVENKLGNVRKWEFLRRQRGMFAYLDLSTDVIAHLRKIYHIYLAPRGRISLASLRKREIPRIVDAMSETLRQVD